MVEDGPTGARSARSHRPRQATPPLEPTSTRLPSVILVVAFVAMAGCIGTTDGDDPLAGSHSPSAGEGGFSDTPFPDGDYDTEGPWSRPLTDGPHGIGPSKVVRLESEIDDADIQIGVVRPDVPTDQEVPVIAVASIYLPDLEGRDLTTVSGGSGPYSFAYGAYYAQTWVPHGYAVAFIPVRGNGGSGGCWEITGSREQADLDQAITWLGARGWSNGNVAMTGLSYDGTTAWAAAAQGNPHLATIVPVAGVTDYFRAFFPNGTVDSKAPGFMASPLLGPSLDPFGQEENVCPGVAEGLAASLQSAATGEPDATGYWEQRRFQQAVLENYEGSVFLAHGLQDGFVAPSQVYPFLERLEDEGIATKAVLGQWGHALPDTADSVDEPRWDWAQQLLHWYDYWLKGNERTDLGAPVQVQDTEGAWRTGETWPPRRSNWTALYPTPSGDLAREPSAETGTVPIGPDETAGLGQHAPYPMGCEHCAAFQTQPLGDDLRIAGAPRVPLAVTPTGPTGHLTAHLYAVHDGEARLLAMGMMDLRFADGGDEAEPIVPGEEIVAHLRLDPLDAVVPEGGKLVLVVSQGTEADATSPLATVFAGERTATVPPSPVLLHIGGDQSNLVVDAFERIEAEVFSPPS